MGGVKLNTGVALWADFLESSPVRLRSMWFACPSDLACHSEDGDVAISKWPCNC